MGLFDHSPSRRTDACPTDKSYSLTACSTIHPVDELLLVRPSIHIHWRLVRPFTQLELNEHFFKKSYLLLRADEQIFAEEKNLQVLDHMTIHVSLIVPVMM